MKSIHYIVFTLTFLFIFGCGSDQGSVEPTLTGGTWKLNMIETGRYSQKIISKPKSYTIKLNDNGDVKIKSDCNKCEGKYNVAGKFIKISDLDCSKKFCGKGSFDYLYKKYLTESSSFTVDDSGMVFESLKGKLIFTQK